MYECFAYCFICESSHIHRLNKDNEWKCTNCDSKQRQITPHKGGRSARLDIRIKPDIKAILEQYAKSQDKSVADVIENFVENLHNKNRKE